MNRVVVRFLDGRIVKGETSDFFPNKDIFHVSVADEPPGTEPLQIHVPELKAVFFVKDYAGHPDYSENKDFNPGNPHIGRRIKVLFKDGEVLVGTTAGYRPEREGFFVEPADPDSNNERCFVVAAAAKDVSFF